mgnify:CR=1 FL=1
MPEFKKSTGYKMKGFSYPGQSPLRQVDPLDLGLIDEAKKFDKGYKATKGTKAAYKFSTSTKVIPKAKDAVGKKLTNILLKGDKLPAEKIIKKHATQKAIKQAAIKKAKKKAIVKIGKKVISKFLGPVGVALTAYEVATTIPKVVKATEKSLKKEARTGSAVGKPKY